MTAIHPSDFTYYDLRRRQHGHDIALLFPGWRAGDERLAILSPHDDDAALGAGYALQAAQANGGEVHVFIWCNGCGGYSSPADKDTIVATRQQETLESFAVLGVSPEHIVRFDYPDYSVMPNLGWQMPWGATGTVDRHLRELRRRRITRVLVPNHYREHFDHEAVYRAGAYDAPQVGDAVLADWGQAAPVRSVLQYSVWADFTPEDALVSDAPPVLRANRAMAAPPTAEAKIHDAIRAFRSQGRIIEGLIAQRQGRQRAGRWLELYLGFDPRPLLDYGPYHDAIDAIG